MSADQWQELKVQDVFCPNPFRWWIAADMGWIDLPRPDYLLWVRWPAPRQVMLSLYNPFGGRGFRVIETGDGRLDYSWFDLESDTAFRVLAERVLCGWFRVDFYAREKGRVDLESEVQEVHVDFRPTGVWPPTRILEVLGQPCACALFLLSKLRVAVRFHAGKELHRG